MQLSNAPLFFRLMSTWFWAIALAMGCVNYIIGSRRAMPTLDEAARAERRSYLRRIAIGMNLPWLIMGAGQLSGATPTVWSYFRPQDGNLFVIAWLVAYFLLACLSAAWVLLGGGAQKVVDLRLMEGLRRGGGTPSVRWVRIYAVLGLVMLPFWVFMVVHMNAPVPR